MRDDGGRLERHPGWWMLAALAGGVTLAVQGRATGALAAATGQPFQAALWNFATGWLVLTAAFSLPGPRAALVESYRAYRRNHVQWWTFFGGVFGATFVVMQGLSVPVVGVALFTVGTVAGQTVGALAVDRAGLGPTGVVRWSAPRVAAGAAALAGVALAVADRIAGPATIAWPLLAALVGGAAVSVSAATNGRIAVAGRNVLAAGWINFTWGCVVLTALAVLRLLLGNEPAPLLVAGMPWWGYVGGLTGIAYVVASALAVRHLGVLVTMLCVLTGQLTGSVVLDLASSATRHLVTPWLLAGTAVTFVAAYIANRASAAPGGGRDDGGPRGSR